MKILSLFDGMSCAMLALLDQGIKVDKYVAYEIDKYAVKTATHNFPEIEQRGDVFDADFTEFRNFDYLMGGSPCFVAGTMVKTIEGIKPIERIKVGDKVLTHKGRYRTVKEVMQRESPYTVIVKAENCGEVECTDEHPFYTKDVVRKWNQSNRCYDRVLDKEFCWTDSRYFHTIRNNSDTIMQQTYLTSVSDCDFIPVEYFGIDIKVNQSNTKHVRTLNLESEAMWYIIGRWVGDGWFSYKYRNGKHLSGIKICCGKHEIEELEKRLKSTGLNYTKNEERTVIKYTISNVELALYLAEFGYGAKNKHLTKDVFMLPNTLALSFLSGYFDADGHLEGRIGSFSTISKELAYGIKYMINKYYKTTCSISKEINHSNKIEGRSLKVSEIYTGTFQTERQKQSHYFVEDNYIYSPYKSVTKVNESKMVYNLSVEDDESYTANGLVVHNCTYWSIAQKNNRETEASGLGWELFSQYVRALKEAQPKYFVYENNKSMSNAIRESVTNTFGFEPICINSALLSAQNRQRLYWVGKRNADGTYIKVEIEQPEDRGILLEDILRYKATRIPDYGLVNKSRPLNAYYSNNCGGFEHRIWSNNPNKQQVDLVVEPVGTTKDGKSFCLTARYYKGVGMNPGKVFERCQDSMAAELVAKDVGCAQACKWDEEGNPIRAIGFADNKEHIVYEVKRGFITIKGKEYPIKLADGYYIIRKLTVRECMRLQTVPEWYDFSVVSDTQAYKMLGNGWTVAVISYLLSHTIE